jgi:diketogulonate reductase-like aldo/keto reductase
MNPEPDLIPVSRRQLLAGAVGLAATGALHGVPALAQTGAQTPIMTRPIPHSGELLPVVGIGTAIIFDFHDDPVKYAGRRQVLQQLTAGGGRLIDTAPAYGNAEVVVGDLVADLGIRDRLFLATKVAAQAPRADKEASLAASLARLKVQQVDVMPQ